MPFEPARNLRLRSDSLLGDIHHDKGKLRVVSQSYTTESYQFISLMMHSFDLIDLCAGLPVRNVYHRVELSHWTTLASAGVRYLFLVCLHYFQFLASRSDVGGETCYAETVHADQTCNSVWGLSTPLTQTRKLCWLSRRAFMAMVNFRA